VALLILHLSSFIVVKWKIFVINAQTAPRVEFRLARIRAINFGRCVPISCDSQDLTCKPDYLLLVRDSTRNGSLFDSRSDRVNQSSEPKQGKTALQPTSWERDAEQVNQTALLLANELGSTLNGSRCIVHTVVYRDLQILRRAGRNRHGAGPHAGSFAC